MEVMLTVESGEISQRCNEKAPCLTTTALGRVVIQQKQVSLPCGLQPQLQLWHQLSKSPMLGSRLAGSLAPLLHSPSSFLALAALHSAVSWIIDWNKSQSLFLQHQLSLARGWCSLAKRCEGPGRIRVRPGDGLVYHIGPWVKWYAVETKRVV